MFSDACNQTFDGIIIPERIVVGQCNPLHARVLRELYDVFDRAMPPTNLFRVFFRSVLRIVDEKIGALNKLGMS